MRHRTGIAQASRRHRTGIAQASRRHRISQWLTHKALFVWVVLLVVAVIDVQSASHVAAFGVVSTPGASSGRPAVHPARVTVANPSSPLPISVAPAGTEVHVANCEQAPAQSLKDRATYSAGELARYGLPARTAHEPFEKWARIVRNAGKRYCDYTTSADHWALRSQSTIWAGNIADQAVPGQNYTETDMDYFMSCIVGIPPGGSATMGSWIGLGGDGTTTLVQTGTAAFQNGNTIVYQAFVENTANTSNNAAIYLTSIPNMACGNHFYVKVWNGNCMYIQRIDDGANSGNWCYGPNTDGKSAEAIAERNPDTSYPFFADFNNVIFRGVGITDNGSYLGMDQVPHDYLQVYDCVSPRGYWLGCNQYSSYPLATVGPIESDPGNPPYDKYTVYWQAYGSRIIQG